MNLDRFGFKAICKSTGTWAFARMAASGFGCFGIRWSDSRAEDYDGCHIYPETLCQCTGWRDSDGNLIYENDIVKIRHCGAEGWFCQRGVVRYDNLHWYIAEDSNDWNDWWESWSLYDIAGGKLLGKLYDVYIIGNKFDKEKENEP